MSRLSVKAYVAKELALLDVPMPLKVFKQRQKEVEVGEGAVLVVDIVSTREQRLTTPRGLGSKRLDHIVTLAVWWLAAQPDPGGDEFDGLLEQIDAVLRAMPIPVMLTDPQSGALSQLVLIGETIDTAVNDPMTDESLEGQIIYSAVKRAAVWEQVQG